ncbi:hypothetical protein H2203_009261 [Taxawa tesnikishii (nom. ined.)]|nr:hypothetical protein H2203_009261 [Dothideales sp. JES 119]
MSSLGTLVSRESRDPTTVCSSWRYAAPEILNERDRRDAHHKKRSYTLAVDIWSLGVTVFECVYDLPSKNATGVSWSQEIVKKLKKDLQRNLDDLKQLLWDTMVIMTPEQRQPAQYCPLLTRIALRLRLQRLKPRVINDQWANTALQTTMAQISQPLLPSLSLDDDDDDDDSAENRRYIRSDGPPPDSQASASSHESWLQDPLHLLGGGSDVAALGQGISEPRGRATQLEETPRYTGFPDNEDFESPSRETRKRSTRQSKSSSSSGRHRKRRGHSFVAAKSSAHRHYEDPEPEALHYHLERNNEDYGPAPFEESNWTEFGVSEDAPVPTHTQDRRGGE